MKICELLEGRNNPKLNPKISAYQAIADRLKNTNDKIGDVTNLFVSFTEINKLGINPRSGWFTPLGIYAYPAEYIVKLVNPKTENLTEIPFAGNAPHINIFSVQGNIVDLSQISDSDVEQYYYTLKQWLESFPRNVRRRQILKQFAELPKLSSREARVSDSPGGLLWYYTKECCTFFNDVEKNNKHLSLWNAIFRKILGIDGLVDNGLGIIHQSEPTQAVFFNTRCIDNNTQVSNKWSTQSKNQGKSSVKIKQLRSKHDIESKILTRSARRALASGNISKIVSCIVDIAETDTPEHGNTANQLLRFLEKNRNSISKNDLTALRSAIDTIKKQETLVRSKIHDKYLFGIF